MHRFLIIGFGKLGSSLGRFLLNAGSRSLLVVDSQPYQTLFGNVVERDKYFNMLSEATVADASFIFICTSDDHIPSVAKQLSSYELKNKYIVHTSGAVDVQPLVFLREQGAKVGSFHPLQTFNEMFLSAERWHSVFCTFQGDGSVLRDLRKIFDKVNTQIIAVTGAQKQAVHLAATITANFQAALFSWATEIIGQSGLEDFPVGKMLGPLVRQVTENVIEKPLPAILSGPLQRGDLQTIRRHVQYLRQSKDAMALELYRLLCLKLLQNRQFPIKNRKQLQDYFDSLEK